MVELKLLALAGGLAVAAYRKIDGPTKKMVRDCSNDECVLFFYFVFVKGRSPSLGAPCLLLSLVSVSSSPRAHFIAYGTT